MSPTITAQQRDLLYEDLLIHLGGIDGIRLAVDRKDYETARRLGLAYSDELRFVCDDLGWGEESPAGLIELRTPPDVLRRVMGRLRDAARRLDSSEERDREELRENRRHNHLVMETCQQVLVHLDAERLVSPGIGNPPPSRIGGMFRIPRPGAITIRLGSRRKRSQ